MRSGEAPEIFDPLIREWFAETYGQPTEIQHLVWPRIAAGEHLLASAPTGSGKTLAAFLFALDRLLSGAWEPGAVRVLYVSPLRALNADIARNLKGPLEALEQRYQASGREFTPVRVGLRSGDTPQRERRAMLVDPPQILVTTPESLQILLVQKAADRLFPGLQTVIVDEIHALADSRRGVQLVGAMEQLVDLSGEFQRLSLSATVRPAERIARWIGGYERHGARLLPRRVEVVEAVGERRIEFDLRYAGLGAEAEPVDDEARYGELARRLVEHVRRNRATLVFGNSRRMVERVTRAMNAQVGAPRTFSHHGSLARELRREVEAGLKAGRLEAIVSTSSLELGIDIGELDEVLLVSTPKSVAAAVQRLGRSGHQVGGISRGRLYSLHPGDLIAGLAIAEAIDRAELEPIRPLEGALDVLCQLILARLIRAPKTVDELHLELRRIDCYHELSRRQLELVIDLLAGRWQSSRLDGLRPRLDHDRLDDTLRARPGAARLLMLSGGTIPERGYFTLRHAESKARIGELDEEFVWERKVGESFGLGVQSWRIESIDHSEVLVLPSKSRNVLAPFWRADELDCSAYLGAAIGRWLAAAAGALDAGGDRLPGADRLDESSHAALLELLQRQRAALGGHLPHRHQVVIEEARDLRRSGGEQRLVLLHTTWGGRVNRPLALALKAMIEAEEGLTVEALHDDFTVLLSLPAGIDAGGLFERLPAAGVEGLLRQVLDGSGFFGARFREVAGVALALPRSWPGRRTPLWVLRQRAKELLAAVRSGGDFPLVLETWRSCLAEEMELETLADRLDEIESGGIELVRVTSSAPSPFAANVISKRTSQLMYEDDVPPGRAPVSIRADLFAEVARSARLRPSLEPALLESLGQRLCRTAPGYAPADAVELRSWVADRAFLDEAEFTELLAAMARDHGLDIFELIAASVERLVYWRLPGAEQRLLVAIERLPGLASSWGLELEELSLESLAEVELEPLLARAAGLGLEARNLAELLGDWLDGQPPRPLQTIEAMVGDLCPALEGALDQLLGEGRVVVDSVTAGSEAPELVSTRVLERALAWTRAERRRGILETRELADLPPFLAAWQGLGVARGPKAVEAALEALISLPLDAALIETDLLPARVGELRQSWVDEALRNLGLDLVGVSEGKIALLPSGALELGGLVSELESDPDAEALFPSPVGRFTLEDLSLGRGSSRAETHAQLWRLFWAGEISGGIEALRHGLLSSFAAPAVPKAGSRRRRWRQSALQPGLWRRLSIPPEPGDPIERAELEEERAEILLDRYGLVSRQLVAHELPAYSWRRILPSLRRLELSGACVGGFFIDGLDGLQFLSTRAIAAFREGPPADRLVWMNACDPASPCGRGLSALGLPPRLPSTRLAWLGRELVLISRRSGRSLELRLPSGHPRLGEALEALRQLVGGEVRPVVRLKIEEINGGPAARAEHAGDLIAIGARKEGNDLVLERSYR